MLSEKDLAENSLRLMYRQNFPRLTFDHAACSIFHRRFRVNRVLVGAVAKSPFSL